VEFIYQVPLQGAGYYETVMESTAPYYGDVGQFYTAEDLLPYATEPACDDGNLDMWLSASCL
jgi:hypothetical protein